MKLYTIAQFKKSTREVLNQVQRDGEVMITRYDEKYVISPVTTFTDPPIFDEATETDITKSPRLAKIIDDKYKELADTSEVVINDSLCEHAAAKGFCKVSKCKFYMFNPKNK